jgi:hypothetical protein
LCLIQALRLTYWSSQAVEVAVEVAAASLVAVVVLVVY